MARESKRLTKAALDRLQAKAKADPKFTAFVADAGQPGLYAWARRGRVRFVLAYRPPGGGRRRRLNIDLYGAVTLDRAREIAGEWRGMVAAGLDPQVEVREEARRAITVAEAVRRYLADLRERAESGARRGKLSGYHSARHRLERHVLPRLGRVKLRAVTVEQVRAMHRSMKATPVEANRTLTCLSAVFGFSDRAELVPSGLNPTRHVVRYEEKGERRALTAEELEALGRALAEAEEAGSVNPSAVLAIRLLALTGFRRAEVLGHETRRRRGDREGLRWGDVDLDAGLVRLADTKTGAQVRVIGDAAVELLRAARPDEASEDDPVCPGARPGQPLVGFNRPRRRVYQAAGLAGLPGVDLHSLRHTFASMGAHAHHGRFAALVPALLGHGYTRNAITERYIHADPEALRPAADAIAGAVAASLGLGERGRVLAFQR